MDDPAHPLVRDDTCACGCRIPLPRGRFENKRPFAGTREQSCAIGHNGLTEVGSDVTAWANVMCTRPVPGLPRPYGYAVNNQAQFASNLAKLRDTLAKVFA
jgi:hypothetical protein